MHHRSALAFVAARRAREARAVAALRIHDVAELLIGGAEIEPRLAVARILGDGALSRGDRVFLAA
jgi:hypothetical protein